eukprot:9726539-Alexandrium_andersonii.AAC.1
MAALALLPNLVSCRRPSGRPATATRFGGSQGWTSATSWTSPAGSRAASWTWRSRTRCATLSSGPAPRANR